MKTRRYASLWRCGDEDCDCSQPVVEELSPNLEAGWPWIHRKQLWSGTFHCEASEEEREAQIEELKKARKELGADWGEGEEALVNGEEAL